MTILALYKKGFTNLCNLWSANHLALISKKCVNNKNTVSIIIIVFSNFDRSVENVGSPGSINTSLDLSQLTSNVAENFSAEMNAWYQNHEQQIDNNNPERQGSSNRSTATLV